MATNNPDIRGEDVRNLNEMQERIEALAAEGKTDEAGHLHREMVRETSRIWPFSTP